MKKFGLLLTFAIIVTLLFCGCSENSAGTKLRTGNYDSVSTVSYETTGDFADIIDPGIYLDTEDETFVYSTSPLVSYAEYGSYTIKDGKLVATTQNKTIYTFEIKDENTLVMIDDNGKVIDKFVYSEQLN